MRNFWLLFCGSLLFHLAGTWTFPLIDRDEPRFAEAAREMRAGGDYVVPYFNNHYRFDKPPLTYWFQTLSYRAFGENDFAARFPSAVAAALTAVLIFAWGKRISSARVAWWAALIFTLSLQTFIHAKAAVADMWLVLFVTAAHWAGYELLRDRLTTNQESTAPAPPSQKWWWIFYLALAFAFLAKGPIGWTPLLAIASTRLFLKEANLSRRFLFFTGAIVMLSVVALWGIPAYLRTDGEFLRIGIGRHVLKRSVVALEGHGGDSFGTYLAALPFYFVTIFLTFAPWSLKLPSLTRALWRKRDPLDNYLIAGAAVIFVIFTLVKTKLPHYTLPAFPLLALLLAKNLAAQPRAESFVRRAALTATAVGLFAVALSPFLARYWPSYQLMREAQNDLKPEMEFAAARYREPSLVWYFRRFVHPWMTEVSDSLVPVFMAKPGGRFVVLPTELAAQFYPTTPDGWKRYRALGFSTANFKWVDLTLLLKPQ